MSDFHIDQIAKLKQTIAALEEQQRTLGVDLSLALNQVRGLLANLEQASPPDSPPGWGVKLNQQDIFTRKRPKTPPEGCPTWANPSQIEDWHKRGLIVWNNATHQFHQFWAEQALGWLDKLRAHEDWRTTGITLTRTISRQITSTTSQPKQTGKRKKGAEIEAPPDQAVKPAYEDFEEECVKLPISAGAEFFAFLVSHETTLQEMATEDNKERSRILGEVYGLILHSAAEHKAAKLDLTARPMSWVRTEDALQYVCSRPPNRATVSYNVKAWLWQANIEQPHHFKHDSPWYHNPEEAMAWAEKELLQTEEEQSAPAVKDDEPFPVSTVDLTPFWIDPAALEPTQITYRIVMLIKREPLAFKTMEMSFGELMKYDEEYPGAQTFARELEIDPTQMQVTQLVPGIGLYEVKSKVTYFTESLATSQAQTAWDRSKIVKAFGEGKIVDAHYGYEEVETGYEVYLGACQKSGSPIYAQDTRAEYMASRAMRRTLLNALDLNGFRAHTRLKKKYVSDEDLLIQMHEERAKSPYLSPEVQAESQRWLSETEHLNKQLTKRRRRR